MKVFCYGGENRHRHGVSPLCEKRRSHSLSKPTVTFVAHDIHDQMHLIGKGLQAGSNGIKTRLQFRQQTDKFFRREPHRRMLNEEIDDFHAPEVSLEVLFTIRSEKIMQRWRSVRALSDGFQKLGCRLRDAVIAQQRLAQRS